MSGKCKSGETANAPKVVESTLGWVVAGSIKCHPSKNTKSMPSTVCIDPVTDSLKRIWELESIGIVDKGEAHMASGEKDSIRQFTE